MSRVNRGTRGGGKRENATVSRVNSGALQETRKKDNRRAELRERYLAHGSKRGMGNMEVNNSKR